jgi:hypothetical protein
VNCRPLGRRGGVLIPFYLLLFGPPLAASACIAFAVFRIARLPRESRRLGVAAFAALLVTAGLTAGYMEFKLEHFARQAGQPIYGLIGRPIPNTGGDHEYTKHGKEYEWSAFESPFYAGSGTMVLLAVGFTIAARQHRNLWLIVWAAAVGFTGAVFIFWGFREFTAWDIFI